MRTYQPIWQRIRANPGVRVPIECPNSFMQRVILAVKKERAMDKVYNRVSAARNKSGIVYKSTAPHPDKKDVAVVSFILVEYAAVGLSDLKYLVKCPPSRTLNEDIGLKELEAENYLRVTVDVFADMKLEANAIQEIRTEQAQSQLTLLKEN